MPNNSVTTALGAVFDTELVSAKHRQAVCLTPCTSGGSSSDHLVLGNTNNARVVKASAGQVYSLAITNNVNYKFFVKLYDKATNPNPATDTPKRVFGVQAGQSPHFMFPNGLEFTLGVAMLVVQGAADTDNTAIAAAADGIVDTEFK